DIMEGVDTTWARVPNGAEIGRLTDDAIAKFNPADPGASVPALLEVHARLAALPEDRILTEKLHQLDRISQSCLGLSVETLVDRAEVVPGESLKLKHVATAHSAIPVQWTGVRYPANGGKLTDSIDLHANAPAVRESTQLVPANTPLSQ